MRRAKRWRAWIVSAALGLSAALALPSPAAAQRYWVTPRTEALSPKDALEDTRLEAEILNLEREGRYFEALSAAEQLLDLRSRVLGAVHTHTLLAVIWAAVNSRRVADYGRAEALYKRVIAELEATAMPRWWIDPEYEGLASVYRDMGDFRRAEEIYLRLLAEATQRDGNDSALKSLADLHKTRGDIEKAQSAYERIVALRERENTLARSSGGGSDLVSLAAALDDLAELLRVQGMFTNAEALFARAVAIVDRRLGTAELVLASTLNHQALLYQDTRELGRAEPLFLRSLAIYEKERGPAHPVTAELVYNLGALYDEMGERPRAEAHYKRALAILKNAFGPEHPRVAACLTALEGLAVAEGKLDVALAMRTEAAAAEDKRLTRLLLSGSEEEKRSFMAALEASTDRTISLHARALPAHQRAAALALTTVLRRKGRVLDAMTDSLAELRKTLAPGDRALLEQLAQVYASLSARSPLVLRAGSPAEAARAPLLEEKSKLEAEVSRRSSAFRADRRPVILSEVQARIPANTALVEVALYRPVYPPKAAAQKGEGEGAPRYIAYVLRSRGDIAFVDLGEAAAIDSEVVALRRAFSDPGRDPRRLARDLDDRIMAKIRPLLSGAERIYVSPDGALNLLPFGALLDGDQRYLLERMSFSYLTSGRDLIRLETKAEPRDGIFVIANPAFEAKESDSGAAPEPASAPVSKRSADMASITFPPLPGTAGEARAIGAKIQGAQLITGPSATETEVKRVAGPRVLHIATHGFFLPKRVRSSAPIRHGLGETDRSRAAAIPDEDPLLRAGLIFAGANHRLSGKDDGVLTAAEASGLDLYGTKLVVLSACETGVGEAAPGEGVMGLRRAFVMAGAETLVMSLWRLDDGATRDLMIAYYDGLKAGAGRSDAMRSAQLALLGKKNTAHPYYWAGFIVSGDGAPIALESGAPGKAPPGPRGCACELLSGRGEGEWEEEAGESGGAGGNRGAVSSLLLAAAIAVARRRGRRSQLMG